LAVQAVNDTNSNPDRSYLDLEFQQLKQEIVRVSETTEWNGFKVLNGTAGERVGEMPLYKVTSENKFGSVFVDPTTSRTIAGPDAGQQQTLTITGNGTINAGNITVAGVAMSVDAMDIKDLPNKIAEQLSKSDKFNPNSGRSVAVYNNTIVLTYNATDGDLPKDSPDFSSVQGTTNLAGAVDITRAPILQSKESFKDGGSFLKSGSLNVGVKADGQVSAEFVYKEGTADKKITLTGIYNKVAKTETATVTFKDMAPKQSLSLGGMTFTAGLNGAKAADVAAYFSNMRDGVTGDTLNQMAGVDGKFAGQFKGFSFDAIDINDPTTLVFKSANAGVNVSDLSASGAGNLPTITVQNGAPASSISFYKSAGLNSQVISNDLIYTYLDPTGASVVTPGTKTTVDIEFKDLSPGEKLTIKGLTYTAGPNGATAAQVATDFSNLNDGVVGADITNALNGTFSGRLSGFSTGAPGPVLNKTITFTSTENGVDPAELVTKASLSLPKNNVNQGVGTFEKNIVQFEDLLPGESITVNNLTFTAGALGANASQLAQLYSGLADGTTASQLQSSTLGTWSGSLTGWKAGYVSGANKNQIEFTSTDYDNRTYNSLGMAYSGSLLNAPIDTAEIGTTETHTIQFKDLNKGESLTFDGLTFTATTRISAADVASAFANIAHSATAASLTTAKKASGLGTWSGTTWSGNWQSADVVDSSKVVFSVATGGGAPLVKAADYSLTAKKTVGATDTLLQQTIQFGTATFENHGLQFKDLKSGEALTIGGLTLTATSDMTASEVATAFSNVADGSSSSAVKGTFSGSLVGWNSSPLTSSSTLTKAQKTVTFKAMLAGDSINVAGLIFTANKSLSNLQVAALFANLTDGIAPPNALKLPTTDGAWTGHLQGWN